MAKKTKKKKLKKKGIKLKTIILALVTIIAMLVFMPTTILVFVGMLPTIVAFIVDKSPEKNKTFTIGALNFAGLFPYLLTLWTKDNSIIGAREMIETPETIIVIYTLAALGYIINWAVIRAVSALMIQKSEMRLKRIGQEKKSLQERWGRKVDGKNELDSHGFPVNDTDKTPT